MFRPLFAFYDPTPERYTPYNYFMNLQAAFDPASGDFYLGRAYPYPYDRQGINNPDRKTPTISQLSDVTMYDPATGLDPAVTGCVPGGSNTLPNRIQIYRMHIGAMVNLGLLVTSTWTLLGDFGHDAGYGNYVNGYAGETTPLVWGQTNSGRDYASVSFLRDGAGHVVRDAAGRVQVFAGDTYKLSKSHGLCSITGEERVTLITVP